jgi:hypothetical protein
VAAEIAAMRPKRVAIWGAGRIFDSLVTHGGLAASSLALLVDTHLKAHVADRFGCPLRGPEDLRTAKLDVVIVMSRAFAGEISREARRLVPGADVILYSDLLARVRHKKAA